MGERAAAQLLRQLVASGRLSQQELRQASQTLRQRGEPVGSSRLLEELLATGRLDLAAVSELETVATARLGPKRETVLSDQAFLGERFRDPKPLGSGGMGQVFQAFDTLLQRPVAIKVLASPRAGLSALLAEARAQARVEHEHVCPIYDVVEGQDRGFVVMRYVPGRSLHAYAGRFSPQQVAAVGLQVAQALHAAHQRGLVHRDVKPANVLVEEVGQELRTTVVDFGLSSEQEDVVAGTPGYLAPEVAQGGRADERADVFGLGATLYYLLAGEPPQKGNSLLELVQTLREGSWQPPPMQDPPFPEDLAWVLRKALAPDPAARYPSALDMACDLERFLRGEPVVAHPLTPTYALRRFWYSHRRLVVLGTAASLLATVTVVAGRAVWQARRQGELASRLQVELLSVEERLRSVLATSRHDISAERAALRREVEEKAAAAARAGLAQESLLVVLGRAYLALGESEQAVAFLQKAVAGRRAPPAAAPLLGAALLARWEGESARVAQLPKGETRTAREKQLQALEEQARSLLGVPSGGKQGTLAKARLAYLEHRFEEAAALAAASRGETPWLYELELFRGRAHLAAARERFRQGQYEHAEELARQAQESFQKAATLAPSHPQAYLGLAQALFEQANSRSERGADPLPSWQQAVELARDALAVDSQAAEARYLQAMAHLRQADYLLRRGRGEEARQQLEATWVAAAELGRAQPQRSWGPTLAGIAFRLRAALAEDATEQERFRQQAHEALTEALRRDENDVLAANNLGLLLWQQGMETYVRGGWPEDSLQHAQALFQRLADTFATNTVLVNGAAVALTRAHAALLAEQDPQSLWQAAEDAVSQALGTNPADTAACNNQAVVFLERVQDAVQRGEDAQALLAQADRWLSRVEALDPSDPVLPENRLRWVALRLQQLPAGAAEAGTLLRQGEAWRQRVVDWEQAAEAQVWWSLVLWEAGRCRSGGEGRRWQRQAWQVWQKARTLAPAHPDLLLVGCAWLARGDTVAPREQSWVGQLGSSPYLLLRRCGERLGEGRKPEAGKGSLWQLAR